MNIISLRNFYLKICSLVISIYRGLLVGWFTLKWLNLQWNYSLIWLKRRPVTSKSASSNLVFSDFFKIKKMILLFNTKIPEKKKINIGLTYIYGLGPTKIKIILKKLGYANTLKVCELSEFQKKKIYKIIDELNYSITVNLKKLNNKYLSKLLEIRKYKHLKKHFKTKKI